MSTTPTRHAGMPSLYPVEELSIEQTICALRRKLGESAKDARLLMGRRSLGYAMIIEHGSLAASVLAPTGWVHQAR